jgi:cleavage stimulation factor subunit 3
LSVVTLLLLSPTYCPSFLLNFAYVEILEENKKFDEVHATFEKFFAVLRAEFEAVEARVQSGESSQSSSQGTPGGADEGFAASGSQSQSQGSQQSENKIIKDHELSDRKKEFGLAWINYMRFARRAEGVKSARLVFGKARKDRWTPWEVYEAAGVLSLCLHSLWAVLTTMSLALLEYHCSKAADIAGRIFEKGMETFSDEIELAVRYLNFLISINDEASKHLLPKLIPAADNTVRCAGTVRACCKCVPCGKSSSHLGPLDTVRVPVWNT